MSREAWRSRTGEDDIVFICGECGTEHFLNPRELYKAPSACEVCGMMFRGWKEFQEEENDDENPKTGDRPINDRRPPTRTNE